MKTAHPAAADDLEALFDAVAAERAAQIAAVPRHAKPKALRAVPPAAPAPLAVNGDEDLDALFERVAAEAVAPAGAKAGTSAAAAKHSPPVVEADGTVLFTRIGRLTRTLHEALAELGVDAELRRAADSLPDARDRLAYIATLTGEAANKVLGAVEDAKAIQHGQGAAAAALAQRWDAVYANELAPADFKRLADDTRAHLAAAPAQVARVDEHLSAIMLAQDFHDLTGQVITKVVALAQTLEQSLLSLLVEATHPEQPATDAGFLNGPAMRAGERGDVVADQAQVDALLDSLGF
jgi:chemotaxis protein CheZ